MSNTKLGFMMDNNRVKALVDRARIGQFLSVGVTGAIIETITIAILTTIVGTGALLAKGVGAELSISTMFIMNDRWTFAKRGESKSIAVIRRWLKSHLVRAGGLLVSFTVLYILISIPSISISINHSDYWPTVANILAIGVGMVLNYITESLFTWRIQS